MPTPHSAPWLKRVLIPFWVVQLVLMLFVFIIFIMLIVAAPEYFTVYAPSLPKDPSSILHVQLQR